MLSICFILLSLISIQTSSYGQVTCASGWVQYGGSCYLFKPAFNSGSTGGTWDQCNAYCLGIYPGATMLCVNNAAENDWMWSQYEGALGWIGYTDMLPYGGGKGTQQYGWVTGCSSTYTNWAPEEPNNMLDNEDYTHFWGLSSDWNDDHVHMSDIHCGCQYTVDPSKVPTAAPSRPSTVPSFRPTASPSSGSTSSPTATFFTFASE
jgi:hypothetical protein